MPLQPSRVKFRKQQRGWMRDMQTSHNDALRVANERYDEEKREGRANSVRLSEMHHVKMNGAWLNCFKNPYIILKKWSELK